MRLSTLPARAHAFARLGFALDGSTQHSPPAVFSTPLCCRLNLHSSVLLYAPGGWAIPCPLSSSWISPVGSQTGQWRAGGWRNLSFCSLGPSLGLGRTEGDSPGVATPHSEPGLVLASAHSRGLSFSLDFNTHTFPMLLQAQFQSQILQLTL